MATTTEYEPPHLHLLFVDDDHLAAFNSAKDKYGLPPSFSVTIHEGRLADLPRNIQFDAIISPANSYGRMDGGFDDALSRAFAPKHDYLALTKVAQAALFKEWKGFAPPGTCTLVDLKHESLKEEQWGCRYMALCPTMRIPQSVSWDRDVVYECTWSLLASVQKHNNRVAENQGNDHREIKSMLATPLATGYGGWSAAKWAAQLLLCLRHFVHADKMAQRWGGMDPISIMKFADEIEKETYHL